MNDLWPSGVASLALKSPGHAARKAEYFADLDRRGSCGSRRATDLEAGTGVNGSVRAVTFGRDAIAYRPGPVSVAPQRQPRLLDKLPPAGDAGRGFFQQRNNT